MILLLVFLSLYIGINIRVSIVLGVIEALLLLAFTLVKFNKKTTLIMMCTTLVGIMVPHLLSLSSIRSATKVEYKGMVAEVRENYFIFSSNLEKFYIYTPYHPYEVGDILVINGDKVELDFNHLESEFDFGK